MGFLADLFGSTNNFHVKDPTGLEYSHLDPATGTQVTPNTGLLPTGQADASRTAQVGLGGALMQQAMGQGPSVADAAYKAATDRNISQVAAQAGSVRGVAPGVLAKQVLQAQAGAGQQAAQGLVQAKAQEQLNAQGTLAQLLAQQRGQDIQQATAQGELGLGTLNAGTNRLGTLGTLQNNQNNTMVNAQLAPQQIQAGIEQNNANARGKIAGGVLGGIGSVLGLSHGGPVSGAEAEVPGDSPVNDKIPTVLSEGEVVIPRSIAHSPSLGAAFMMGVKSASHSSGGYGDVVRSRHGYADGGMVEPGGALPDVDPELMDLQEQEPVSAPASEQVAPPQQGGILAGAARPDSTPGYPMPEMSSPTMPMPAGKAPSAMDVPGVPQQLSGIQEKGNAEAALGQEKSKLYDKQAQEMDAMRVSYGDKYKTLQKQGEDLFRDVRDGKINPNQYWESKSTAGKVSTAIGIILGGMGQGMMGGSSNQALDFFNKHVENDIDAQKANLNKSSNLLSRNLEQTKDLREAEMMTRQQLLTTTAAQVEAAGARASSKEAKSNAQILSGSLVQQATQLASQQAILQARRDMMTGMAQGARINPEILPKEDRERMVDLHDGRQMFARSVKDAEDIKEQVSAVNPLMKQLDRLDKLGPKALIPGSKEAQEAQSIRAGMVAGVNHALKYGRLNETEIELIKQQIYDPSSFRQLWGGQARSQAFRKVIGDALEANYKTRLSGYEGKPDIRTKPRFGVNASSFHMKTDSTPGGIRD